MLCIAATIFNYDIKIQIIEKLYNHDTFMKEKFQATFNMKSSNSRTEKKFISFVISNIFLSFLMVYGNFLNFPVISNLNHIIRFAIVCHFVHVHCFLFFIFVTAVEQRLELIRRIKPGKFGKNCDSTSLKTAFLQILDLVQQINEYFKPCLAFVMFQLSYSVVSIIYWIGITFLDSVHAYVLDCVAFVIPNLLILLMFARSDRKIRRNVSCIISNIIRSKHPQKEDILIFLLRKKFNFGAFGFVNIGFEAIGEVKTFLNFLILVKT